VKRDGDQPSRVVALHVLERAHNLFDFKVDGWSAWRVLRNPLHSQAEALPLAQLAQTQWRRVLSALYNSLRLLGLLIAGDRCDLLVKTSRSGLRMPAGEQYRDVYYDGLLATGYSFAKLEEINSPDFERQAAVACFPATLDPVVFTFWGMIFARLLPLRSARSYCDRISVLLAEDVGMDTSSRWLLTRISTAYWQSRFYGLLLNRLRPKAVLVSDTGEYGLIIACKRQGVFFLELQHGVFDANHPDAIPAWVDGTPAELLLPDTLACRGEYWIEQLANTRQGRDHARAVGNELIDLARERRKLRCTRPEFQLVLSSQGLDSDRLSQWVAEFVTEAPDNLAWRLVIKLHPAFDIGNHSFDFFSDPRISVIGGADIPNIYDLLADADLHLSIASACHFDAAALGVPTVVIPLAGHEAMLKAIDGRLIHLASKPSDPWSLLLDTTDDAVTERFSEPGFIFNLTRLLPC
jgi:hypothetical protein